MKVKAASTRPSYSGLSASAFLRYRDRRKQMPLLRQLSSLSAPNVQSSAMVQYLKTSWLSHDTSRHKELMRGRRCIYGLNRGLLQSFFSRPRLRHRPRKQSPQHGKAGHSQRGNKALPFPWLEVAGK